MMKRFSILMMAFLLCASFSAEATNFNQLESGEPEKAKPETKPWRSINLSSNLLETTFTFTNGKQFNKNFFAGYGMGIDYMMHTTISIDDNYIFEFGGFSVPVFVDGKWRLFNTWISPSLRLRTGAITYFSHASVGGFILPEVGLDISRHFSLSLGWIGQVYYQFGELNDWVQQSTRPYIGLSVNF